MLLQVFQAKIFPAQDGFHRTRDKHARRQHQGGIRRDINCDFDPVSARAHADCAALPVRCQQNHGHRQYVRQQIRELGRVAQL